MHKPAVVALGVELPVNPTRLDVVPPSTDVVVPTVTVLNVSVLLGLDGKVASIKTVVPVVPGVFVLSGLDVVVPFIFVVVPGVTLALPVTSLKPVSVFRFDVMVAPGDVSVPEPVPVVSVPDGVVPILKNALVPAVPGVSVLSELDGNVPSVNSFVPTVPDVPVLSELDGKVPS
jgi:hypothetical protein